MKTFPTQERAIKKRIALLRAALDEFASVGFEVATAKSIAARAGVATGTFYQYFENKNEILRVIAENRFTELHEQVTILESQHHEGLGLNGDPEPASDLFKRVLGFLYQYHLQEVQLHKILDQRRGLDLKLEQIMSKGEDLMRSLLVRFISGFDLHEPEAVADSLYAMGEGLVHRMVFTKPAIDPDKMLEIGSQMLASYFEHTRTPIQSAE